MLYLFKGCGKCCGDLALDGDEWRCFQCGRVYYPNRSAVELQLDAADVEHVGGERPKVRRSVRHLNPVLAATRFNEEQWWAKNETAIYHLDQGKKVREISEIVGQAPGRFVWYGNGSATCAPPNRNWSAPAKADRTHPPLSPPSYRAVRLLNPLPAILRPVLRCCRDRHHTVTSFPPAFPCCNLASKSGERGTHEGDTRV